MIFELARAGAEAGEVASAAACMIRKNAESFPRLDIAGIEADAVAPFLPYRDGNDDPELEQGSFGRAFYDHFKRNEFASGQRDGPGRGFHHSARLLPSAQRLHGRL